jgi:hypothetical protein
MVTAGAVTERAEGAAPAAGCAAWANAVLAPKVLMSMAAAATNTTTYLRWLAGIDCAPPDERGQTLTNADSVYGEPMLMRRDPRSVADGRERLR